MVTSRTVTVTASGDQHKQKTASQLSERSARLYQQWPLSYLPTMSETAWRSVLLSLMPWEYISEVQVDMDYLTVKATPSRRSCHLALGLDSGYKDLCGTSQKGFEDAGLGPPPSC